METKWKEINDSPTCPITGRLIMLESYIKLFDKVANFRSVQKVDVKQFYWNTGNTAFSRAESYILYERSKLVGIYIIRHRNDGWGTKIYKFDGTYEQWLEYSEEPIRVDFMKCLDRFNNM